MVRRRGHGMTVVARAGARVGTLAAVSVAMLLRGFLGGDVPVRIEDVTHIG